MSKELFPVGTVVRIKRTNEFAIIRTVYFLMNNPDNFLHYEAEVEGRKPGARYALYHDDIELECLPLSNVDGE